MGDIKGVFPLINYEFHKPFMHKILLEFVIFWCKSTHIFSCKLKKNLCIFMFYCTNLHFLGIWPKNVFIRLF